MRNASEHSLNGNRTNRLQEDPANSLNKDEGRSLLSGITVLLVEDTFDMRRLISRMLMSQGARVYSAASAKEARTLLNEINPDVIISDIAMPEEDGIGFLTNLRETEKKTGHHIPAIALTAFIGTEYRGLTLRAGFEEHLCKPVTTNVLVTAILRVMCNRFSPKH